MMKTIQPEVFTPTEACVYLSMSKTELWRDTVPGKIPYFKNESGRTRYRRKDLERYLENRMVRNFSDIPLIANRQRKQGRTKL